MNTKLHPISSPDTTASIIPAIKERDQHPAIHGPTNTAPTILNWGGIESAALELVAAAEADAELVVSAMVVDIEVVKFRPV